MRDCATDKNIYDPEKFCAALPPLRRVKLMMFAIRMIFDRREGLNALMARVSKEG